ncbi:MAG: AAA family ATPase [Candidatus Binatia bacterium]
MGVPPHVAVMLRPEFYPHRPAAVTLVQTHISYVLLAGEEVYKVKKPIRFPFLDFSTLARRRHFCHEEVRLNRRLTTGVYHGVRSICPAGEGYRLGAEGDPEAIEYAVHMRRLPADRMLDQLLDRGQVTPEMIEQIAARLAAFHARAAAGAAVTAKGDPSAVAGVLGENYSSMQRFRGVTIPPGDDDAIQRFAREFLERRDALFRRRQQQQRIRDCHGDLHSEHICFGDVLQIFDCIEFSPAFRYCDVASEIAFLAMDLDYHGRSELAAQLVARYASYANDADLGQLVPFYQCYRAYVRGKVESLTSAEEEVPPAERDAARRRAWRYFALAYRYTWSYSPCLVAIGGLSGTGKSALAAALHIRTGFAHINSDVVRKQLAQLPAGARSAVPYATGLYAPEHSARTYRSMLVAASEQLAAGRGVILDATFQRRADRDAARAVAREHGAPFVIVECRCDAQTVRERLNRRVRDGGGPSDADWAVYLEQCRHYEALGPDERNDQLVLDTTAPTADLTPAIESALRARVERPG